MKKYNVFSVHLLNGRRVQMNHSPMTHTEACTFRSKLTPYPSVCYQLVEVNCA